MRAQTLLISAVVAGVIAGLSGCAIASGSGVSAADARARFTAVIDETQALLGGAWTESDDPTARSCTVPILAEGVRYPALRLADAPASVEEASTLVREDWTDRGFAIEATRVGDVEELSASSPAGDTFLFRASDDAMTLQGESECRPR